MAFMVYKWKPISPFMLVFQFSVLTSSSSTASSTKLDEVLDPSIKCGECPCVNPCINQPPAVPPPPPPPPPVQYCNPPPPRSVSGIIPPPPPRFIYVTGAPGSLHPTDDSFSLQIYSNAAHESLINVVMLLLLGFSALSLQLLEL